MSQNPDAVFVKLEFTRRKIAEIINFWQEHDGLDERLAPDDDRLTVLFCRWFCREYIPDKVKGELGWGSDFEPSLMNEVRVKLKLPRERPKPWEGLYTHSRITMEEGGRCDPRKWINSEDQLVEWLNETPGATATILDWCLQVTSHKLADLAGLDQSTCPSGGPAARIEAFSYSKSNKLYEMCWRFSRLEN